MYKRQLQGWMFDFSDILRTYIVKQYGHWAEYKATDKTALRSFLYGRIDSYESSRFTAIDTREKFPVRVAVVVLHKGAFASVDTRLEFLVRCV